MTETQRQEIEEIINQLKEIDETLDHAESRHVTSAILELEYLTD